jgi:hypothetical protein
MIRISDSAEEIIYTSLDGTTNNIATVKIRFWRELINEVRVATIKECAEVAMIHDGYIGLKINQLSDQIK